MGVLCDLRLIDHERVVVGGLLAVNRALTNGHPAIVRDYIASLPFVPDADVINYRQARLAKLRELQAPDVIIDNEVRLLGFATGDAYQPAALINQSLDELRVTLGQWNWVANSYSLDKAWYELDWFLQPGEGEGELLLYPPRPKVGEAGQTLLDEALVGSERSPLDISGSPIIRTCGSDDPDCFGYNDPPRAAEIHRWLAGVDIAAWEALLPTRKALYQRASPALDAESIDRIVCDELEFARHAFQLLCKAYQTAAGRKLGVACEYSL